MEFFQHTHKSLLGSIKPTIKRELLNDIDWNEKLICIKGFRGVGKTTFLLDYIRKTYPESNDVLYNGIVSINHLEGLSFREYLNSLTDHHFRFYTFDEIISNHIDIAKEIVSQVRPLAFFDDYLKHGYFPYFIDDPNFYIN